MPRGSLSLRASPGGLLVPVGCLVCRALEGFPVIVSCLSGPGGLSCPCLSCQFSPGGLLIPPHFPMEIFWGGRGVPAVGAGPRGVEAKGPEDHLPWPPELPSSAMVPRAPSFRHGPQSSQLHHGLQSSLHRHGFQSSQLRHGPCLSVLLWRSPSCVPVCVCPEGPPERPPPLPDGTVKARDEPFGRGEFMSVLCRVCHVSPPHASLFGLFPVLV